MSETETIIRQYQSEDLPQLMAVWESANALAHSFLREDVVSTVRRDIPALYIPNADVWVAVREGKVVGFLALLGNEVGAIFLDPEHHGKRIGKMMMDHAVSLHSSLTLEVFKKNTIGRGFYSKYGFVEDEEKLHEPSGEISLCLSYNKK